MKLSVVATLFRSGSDIAEFHRRASDAARRLAGDDYEIVLVNDGSPDNSLALGIGLSQVDPRVVVVDLSRNFGHHRAMMVGLEHAHGDLVFLIDSDLEEDPDWLAPFAEALAHHECDVVYGQQIQRKGKWFERVSGEIFYRLFNLLASVDHPRDITTARLMTRRYVNSLLLHREREMVISGLWLITGYKQISLPITKKSISPSTYTLARKITHLVNAVTSFSATPLYMIFYCGFAIFVAAVIYAVYLAAWRMFSDSSVEGWTTVVVSVWILGGLTISFIGIIGIYLAKVFSETKQRPTAIVRDVHGDRRG